MSTMVAPVATIPSTMLLRTSSAYRSMHPPGRGRARDDQEDGAVLVGQHLVVDVGRAAEVAAGEAHVLHGVHDRARVEGLDIDMLDLVVAAVRLAGCR
jgi:hypothetical protein